VIKEKSIDPPKEDDKHSDREYSDDRSGDNFES
jgi:hypothetical protein